MLKLKETYSVVVESGNCSTDYQKWEEKANCGHNHRTTDVALKCKEKLTVIINGHQSAKWFGATIHNQDGERVEY